MAETFIYRFVSIPMRAPKAQLCGISPQVRAPKVQSYGTCLSLHVRVGTFASILLKFMDFLAEIGGYKLFRFFL